MRHILFGSTTDNLTTALLIKESSFNKSFLMTNYTTPLARSGVKTESIIAFTLTYDKPKRVTAAHKKEYLDQLLPELDKLGITTLYVADADYFKTLCKVQKVDPHHGYTLDCKLPGYEHFKVILGVNYQAVVYNPLIQEKLDLSIQTLTDHLVGTYADPGNDIIFSEYQPKTIDEIRIALQELHQYKELTADIEAYSLKFYDAGIGTISFAWDEHHGIKINVDCVETEPTDIEVWDTKDNKFKTKKAYHKQGFNTEVRALLKEFFIAYQGTLTWHNIAYDTKVIVYQLWMKDLADYAGMLDGIEVMTRNFDDTKLIAYCATNNTVQNTLGLKPLAQPFAGNYGMDDIKDIRLIPLPDLLRYNLVDCLSTWYVKDTYWPKMAEDDQLDFYQNQMKPAVGVIMQMELCGMPIDPTLVQKAKATLKGIVDGHMDYLQNSPIVKDFHHLQMLEKVDYDNTQLKKKVRVIEDFADVKFNPGSDIQLQKLIYTHMGYEVIDLTKSKQPATGWKTINKLINHAKEEEHKKIFENLIGLTKANKILTSFIPAFEQAQQLPDGSWRLYGNFNLGGTQSGRLSSSGPNMQNIPSGSVYAKIIKSCFVSPPGWIFCGADFRALEAVVGALLPMDPAKLKVYTEGYDSHCVNTFAYFPDQLPDIVDTVESINSIQDKYPKLRRDSKPKTFALQYFGTRNTLMQRGGLSQELANQVYTNYHKLYHVSDTWIEGELNQAHAKGYIIGAFGLKIRTPILAQTVVSDRMPYMAEAERRSAGNAKTQSYGLLNSRAAIEFMDRVRKSPYRLDIMLSALIHDAVYILVKDKPGVAKWTNDNLIDCMKWNELPELQHDIVKLGAEMDIYWPAWNTALTLPNDLPEKEIKAMAKKHLRKTLGTKWFKGKYQIININGV